MVRLRALGRLLVPLTAWLFTPCSPLAGEALVYAPLPLENPSLTLARNQPLAALLARRLERAVEVRLYPDHASLLEDLARGEIDLAELGPLPFLLARERVPGLRAVAKFREPDGQAKYRCVLVAPVDGVQSLAQFAAREPTPRVALTRPESTCGPAATFWLLAQQGIAPDAVRAAYLGGHDEVALAVLREDFAIGGLKESVAWSFHGLGLRVLATSEPVPGFVLVARPDNLSPGVLDALAEALPSLESAQLAALQNGRHGFVAFETDLFERVETMRVFAAGFLDRVTD